MAFVDTDVGDWLLWYQPSLRGRVALNALLEPMTSRELGQQEVLRTSGRGWRQVTGGYRSVTLAKHRDGPIIERLLRAREIFRIVYQDDQLVVFARRRGNSLVRFPPSGDARS